MASKITLLQSKIPITKRYELGPKGELIKHSYPFIHDFTSHTRSANNLPEMLKAIQEAANKGWCLLKGNVHRTLVNESRAGSTDRDDSSSWICLDFDGIHGYQNIDEGLVALGCGDVSYILQWSSSMGIENKNGFRCHVFMNLDHPVHPQLLKQWLMDQNLSIDNLNKQLELTKTGNALKWPLDITTCQNDKLLYVAAPTLGKGIKDPFKTGRISLVKKKHQTLKLPGTIPSKEALQQRVDQRINELRVATNLPKRKATKIKFEGAIEYMANPESCTVTEIKHERGFVYFNLNGGDSWGYYHPEDNPTYIFNFKGEPAYRTEDLLPEYWAKQQQRVEAYQPDAGGNVYLAFRDFESAQYYNGIYNQNTRLLELNPARSETQLRHFMKQHGQPMGEFVPDWRIGFDPTNADVIDLKARTINTFKLSVPMSTPPKNQPKPPPTIHKLISHILGMDTPTIDHFYNWLACIVRYMTRTETAWVLQGTQGTGKGLLFHKVLTPLFGQSNVTIKRMDELDDQFNGYIQGKFLFVLDEMQVIKNFMNEHLQAKLKNWIVEPRISVRRMHNEHREIPNYCNLIFNSNKAQPTEVPPNDRRYNVGPYQAKRLAITNVEVERLTREVPSFFDYLMTRPADQDKAREPIQNAARAKLMDISRSSVDMVSDAINTGDLPFLWDQLKTHADSSPQSLFAYQPYSKLIKEIVDTQPKSLSRDELYIIYEWCVGNMPKSPNRFSSLLKHHEVHLIPVWHGQRTTRGVYISWKVDAPRLAQMKKEIAANLVI